MGGSVALISDSRPVNANHFLNGGANRYHTYMSQKGWVTSQMGSGQHRKTDLESSRNATVQRPQLKLLTYSNEYLHFLHQRSKCFQVAYSRPIYPTYNVQGSYLVTFLNCSFFTSFWKKHYLVGQKIQGSIGMANPWDHCTSFGITLADWNMAHDEVSWSAKDSVISQDRTEDLEARVHLLKWPL